MRRIRLTEGQLHRIIKESVRNILSESDEDSNGTCYLVRYLTESDEDFDKCESLIRKGQVEKAVDYLSKWDFGGENIDSYGYENIDDIKNLPYQDSYDIGDYVLIYNDGTGSISLYRLSDE